MPRPPKVAPSAERMPGAVYTPFAERMAQHPGPLYPLHVGDTWMEPFDAARMESLRVDEHPGMHRYCDTRGIPDLLDAIVEKVRSRNELACERDSVLVTAGATGGLATVLGAILAPGEEVLILAPFWPLIRGIVQAFGGEPVEVPFYDRVADAEHAVAAVREHLSERTVALYISTPSNPTGQILPRAWLEALADFAREADLWLLSDEVYEDYVYAGEHVSAGRFAPERTLTSFSFSKAYGMAGNRVGYITGPEALVTQARKLATHTYYTAPTPGQLAAVRALRDGADWVERARELYREAGRSAARELGVREPEGSTFLFIDASPWLDERGLDGFLSDCLDDGVVLSPGGSSGQAYTNWVRLCYTAAPPDDVATAISLLARRLGRGATA